MTTTLTRHDTVAALRERDGDTCAMPFCDKTLDFGVVDGPWEVTIDHWHPQWWCKQEGWTLDEIWALSNLKLAHKTCNAKKGERIPDEDGILPERPERKKFRYRRDKRAQRPEICTSCNAGRFLGPDEWCNSCGSGPNPGRFPKWRQMNIHECDHDLFYCVSCTIWFPNERRSVMDSLLTGGDGYEDAE